MIKPRIMYIVHEFPQISQTYIRAELEALIEDYEISVISIHDPDIAYKEHVPFRKITDIGRMREAVEEFKPDILHSHWLQQIRYLAPLSRETGVPYTIRAHSFDSIRANGIPPRYMRDAVRHFNSDNCLGILAFPFTRALFEKAGIQSRKIHDCFPVIHYPRFYDRSPNGDAVMNVGACIPKKRMQDYLDLATKLPAIQFNLYPMGHQTDKIKAFNNAAGNPVHISECIEPQDMPAEYKKHRWLVYTACWELKTVGWPMAVAEAQASGVGVCVPNIRPDMKDYVGPAGYLYNSLDEVIPLVSGPFSEERRELGFEHAKKSDVFSHKVILTDLWDSVKRKAPHYVWTHGRPSLLRRTSWKLQDAFAKVREKALTRLGPPEQDDGI